VRRFGFAFSCLLPRAPRLRRGGADVRRRCCPACGGATAVRPRRRAHPRSAPAERGHRRPCGAAGGERGGLRRVHNRKNRVSALLIFIYLPSASFAFSRRLSPKIFPLLIAHWFLGSGSVRRFVLPHRGALFAFIFYRDVSCAPPRLRRPSRAARPRSAMRSAAIAAPTGRREAARRLAPRPYRKNRVSALLIFIYLPSASFAFSRRLPPKIFPLLIANWFLGSGSVRRFVLPCRGALFAFIFYRDVSCAPPTAGRPSRAVRPPAAGALVVPAPAGRGLPAARLAPRP
jgi:hypothetical protein